MDYIITLSDGRYFTGWDTLDGSLKFISEKSLAYRMRRPIAMKTMEKINSTIPGGCTIEKLAN